MSSPRYGWWSYAKAMIRAYPQLHREYEQLHSQKVTASISGMPGGGGASRTTEDIALRRLPGIIKLLNKNYETRLGNKETNRCM